MGVNDNEILIYFAFVYCYFVGTRVSPLGIFWHLAFFKWNFIYKLIKLGYFFIYLKKLI